MRLPFISLIIITGILSGSVLINQDSLLFFSVQAKLLCSLFLLVIIFYNYISSTPTTPCYLYARWLFFGMAFGFIGDLIMMEIIPIHNYIVGGIIAFGAGHLCYINAFNTILSKIQDFPVFIRIIFPIIILTSTIWGVIIYSPIMSLSISISTLFYGLLLMIMVGYAIILVSLRIEFILVAIGAILFSISDIILGNNLYKGDILQGSYSFIFYIIGQWGIIMSSFSCRCQE